MMPRILFAFLVCWASLQAQTLIIRMGTLAPQKSKWDEILLDMGEKWKKVSGGKVELKVYAGGEQGDEPAMVEKLRIRKLQSVALSGAGLSGIEPGVSALQIPMMLDSYAELDYVRDHISDRLDKGFEQRGFIVLNWADAGWVHFFTKTPATKPDQIRNMKLCVLQGDNGTYELYKNHGFHPVALAATDIMTGLQTGLIDAFQSPPLLALASQWFGGAHYMLDVRFAQLVGATLIDKRVWDQIPANTRTEMLKISRDAGKQLREEIRKAEAASIPMMEQFGLQVVHADAPTVAEWKKLSESIYPNLRGSEIPVDLFDQVKRLRDEYRKAHPAQTAAGAP
jgi:TRAP-type C4-dicarboxylate transport system substrate-binding protein